MELNFKPKISSEISVVDDVVFENNIYEVSIFNNNKSIQKSYLGTKGENLVIDDFKELGNWKLVIKLGGNIIFEAELNN